MLDGGRHDGNPQLLQLECCSFSDGCPSVYVPLPVAMQYCSRLSDRRGRAHDVIRRASVALLQLRCALLMKVSVDCRLG